MRRGFWPDGAFPHPGALTCDFKEFSGFPAQPSRMRFRVLYVLCHGYGLALAIAAMASFLGASALASVLVFWFGGALLCLALPVPEAEEPSLAFAVPARSKWP